MSFAALLAGAAGSGSAVASGAAGSAPVSAWASIAAALPSFGLIEGLALVGMFLYGLATVVVIRTVHRDGKNKLADDVLAF
jgi:hypothetical protein